MKRNNILISSLITICAAVMLLSASCAVGQADQPAGTISINTFAPASASAPAASAALPSSSVLPADSTPEITPEPTVTPPPTEEPTERPPVDSLVFNVCADTEGESVKVLCAPSKDAPEGYKDNVLANIFDNNEATYWSYRNSKLDVQLVLEFRIPVYLELLDNWWFTLDKIYYYDLYTKMAGGGFEKAVDRSENTSSDETQDRIGAGPVEAVRYDFYDNSLMNKWVQFAEVYMKGAAFGSDDFEIDYANKVIRIPGEISSEEFVAHLNLYGKIRLSLGNTADRPDTVTDASVLRVEAYKMTDDYYIEYLPSAN